MYIRTLGKLSCLCDTLSNGRATTAQSSWVRHCLLPLLYIVVSVRYYFIHKILFPASQTHPQIFFFLFTPFLQQQIYRSRLASCLPNVTIKTIKNNLQAFSSGVWWRLKTGRPPLTRVFDLQPPDVRSSPSTRRPVFQCTETAVLWKAERGNKRKIKYKITT